MTKREQVLQKMTEPKLITIDYEGAKWSLVGRKELEAIFARAKNPGGCIRFTVNRLRQLGLLKNEIKTFDGGYFVKVGEA